MDHYPVHFHDPQMYIKKNSGVSCYHQETNQVDRWCFTLIVATSLIHMKFYKIKFTGRHVFK
jgi:phage pi2 protein 07